MYRKCLDYKITDFLQTLKNGKKVFDFSKIDKIPHASVLILTERGAFGKTLNIKDYLRKKFQHNGNRSIWLGNTENTLVTTKDDWYEDLEKPVVMKSLGKESTTFWDNTKFRGKADEDTLKMTYDDKTFIKFIKLNSAELSKGARPEYNAIIWDEFNVKFERIQKPIDKFMTILHSTEDVVNGTQANTKLFIFGNNKTLNNRVIYSLGVTHVDNELMELYSEDGLPIMLVIAPKYNKEAREIKEDENKGNWIYQVGKLLHTNDHNYNNDSAY